MASNSNGNGNGHLVHNEPEARSSRGPWSAIRTMVTNIVYDRLQAFSRWLDPRRSIEHECGYPSRVIDPDFYQELYERDPIAARVVEVFPKECWQVQPSVYEDDDPDTNTRWEDAFAGLGAQLAGESYHGEEKGSLFWDAVRRADIASRVCRYGAVVVLLDDGNPLDPSGAHLQTPARMRPYKPLKGSTGSKGGVAAEQAKANGEEAEEVEEDEDRGEEGEEAATENQQQFSTAFPYNPMYPGENEVLVPPGMVKERLAKAGRNGKGKGGDGAAERRLLGLHVFTEAQCRIQEYDQNPASPRFGQPLLYSVTFGDPRQTMGPNMPLVQTTVHWTRVIPLAEDLRGSGPQTAAPAMEPVLNRLLDLRKVYGPDAEGYYRNGIPGWAFETHKELGSADLDKESLKDAWEEYQNSMTRLMATEGGTLKPLTTSLADPKPHIEIQIEAICIKLGVPVRVFKGSERGELASSQDDAAWNDRLRERQHNYLTPKVLCPIIDRLIALYVLPVPESPDGYKVWWPDLESQGAAEKATIASTQVTALATFFDPAKGVFNEMAPMDFWTKVMGYDEDEAKAIIRNAEKEKAKRQKEADELKVKEQEQQLAFQDAEARAGMERDMEFQAQQAEQQAAQEAAAAAPAEGGNVAGGTPVGAEGADALMDRLTTENERRQQTRPVPGRYGGFRYDPTTNQFYRTDLVDLIDDPAPTPAATPTDNGQENGQANRHFDTGPDGNGDAADPLLNIFCPTGPGGGINPTCKAGADAGVGPGAGSTAPAPQTGWERQVQPNGVTVDTKTGGTRTRLTSDKGEAEVWQGAGDKQWRVKHGGEVQMVGSKEEGLSKANSLLATKTPATPTPSPTPTPRPAPAPAPKNLPKTNDLTPEETQTALTRLAQLPKDQSSDYGKSYKTDSVRAESLGMVPGEFRPEFSKVAHPSNEKKGRLGNVPLEGIKTSQDAVAAAGLAAYAQRQPDPKKEGWPEVAKFPDGTYQIISGHTRLGAVALAGRTHGRAKVYTFDENGQLVENERSDGLISATLLDNDTANDNGQEDGQTNRPFAAGHDENGDAADPVGNANASNPAADMLDIWEDADAWWWDELVERLKAKALSFLGGDYYGQPGVVEEGRDRLEGFDDFLLDLDRTINEALADPDVKDGALDMLVDAYLDGAEMAYRDAGPGGGKDQMREFIAGVVTNIFCPTGKGGGIDPTCKAGGLGGYRAAAHGPPAPPAATSVGSGATANFTSPAGVPYFISNKGSAEIEPAKLAAMRKTFERMPKVLQEAARGVVYNPGGGTYARPGESIVIGDSIGTSFGIYVHEAAHNLGLEKTTGSDWEQVRKRDAMPQGWTSYTKMGAEDFAESVKLYVLDQVPGALQQQYPGKKYRDVFPERAKFLDQLLSQDAPTANAAREFVYGLVGNATPPRDVWGQFMSAKAKEMSDRLAAGWKVQAGAVSQGIAAVVTKGIAAGKTAEEISAEILDFSAGVPKARADVIARTEVTRAAAEGQLDAYGRLGVSELTADTSFELRTQGKNGCPDCVNLEKLGPMPIEKARGLIPVHPNCKCRWRVIRSVVGVRNDFSDLAVNIFCKTGKGGGVDPTCKKGERGGNLGERLHGQREALHDARVALAEAKKEITVAADGVARQKAFLAEEQAKLPQITASLANDPDNAAFYNRRADAVKRRIEYTQKSLQRSEALLKKAQANERQQAAKVAKIEKEAETKLRHLDNPKLKKANEYTTGDVKRLLEQYKDRDSSPKLISVDAADRVAYAITKTAVPVPGGVQRHGMSQREDMVEVSINGTKVRYPKEPPHVGENVVRHLVKTLGMDGTNSPMPDKLVKATNEVVYTSQRNSNDGYWEKTYGISGFTSAATGGDGKIVVYNGNPVVDVRTFAHESGHNLASQIYGTTTPSDTSRYGQAQRKEAPVSEYGSKSPSEDFAEAARRYAQDPARLKQEFPEKYAAMHELLGE